jgi:hypothetical protein
VAVVREQLLPHLGVAALDHGELPVDLLLSGVRLLSRESDIEVGGVVLVMPVVLPLVDGAAIGRSRGRGCGHRDNIPRRHASN